VSEGEGGRGIPTVELVGAAKLLVLARGPVSPAVLLVLGGGLARDGPTLDLGGVAELLLVGLRTEVGRVLGLRRREEGGGRREEGGGTGCGSRITERGP
jgi:hypothetical protein